MAEPDIRWAFLRASSSQSKVQPQPHRITFAHTSPTPGQVALDHFPASDRSITRPDHVLVFMLGNPGILEYYHSFLSHLSALLPRVAIVSTSHIGHSPSLPAPEVPLSLAEQLEAKVELIDSLRGSLDLWRDEDGDSEVSDEDWVDAGLDIGSDHAAQAKRKEKQTGKGRIGLSLMGHSIGAWMAVETAKRLEDQVDGVFMLFPTVGWIADSANGQRLKPIFAPPLIHLLPLLATLLTPLLLLFSALPAISSLLHLPPPTIALLRSPRTIRHVLRLAKSEMMTVREPDMAYFEAVAKLDQLDKLDSEVGPVGVEENTGKAMHKPREERKEVRGVYGVWSDEGVDKWVGREGRMVQAVLGGQESGRVKVVGKIPHAFCLSLDHSRHVAEILASWLDKPHCVAVVPPGDNNEAAEPAAADSEVVASFPM